MASSKGIRTLALGVALCSILSTTALAAPAPCVADDTTPITVYATPRWTQISQISPGLTVSGTTLKISTLVNAKNSTASISGTVYLEKKSGSSWTSVTSWDLSGTGRILLSKSYTNADSGEYRTRVEVTVAGESATAYSLTRTV